MRAGVTGAVALCLLGAFAVCQDAKESQGNNKAAQSHNSVPSPTDPEISDGDKVAVCAGGFSWLAMFARANKDENAEDLRKLGYWFQSRADEIDGHRALVVSLQTIEYLQDEAKKTGARQAALDGFFLTSDCSSLVMRVLPKTKDCFKLTINTKHAQPFLAYDFVCK